jgi:hypothetical protein
LAPAVPRECSVRAGDVYDVPALEGQGSLRGLRFRLGSALSPAFLWAAAGCSASPSGTLQIVTGEETDTFSRAPAPVKLEVDSVDSSGHRQTLATVSLPAPTIDLGSLATQTVASLQVTGTSSDGSRLVYGQSIPLLYGALDKTTLPIFVQRTGELARLPEPLSDARPAPTLALIGGRYLFVGAGGDPSVANETQLYDFVALAPLASPPVLPRVPMSIAFVGTIAWLIDDGGATQFDFSTSIASVVTAPSGGSFADVAGGATVFASDGSQYVVGATRAPPAPPTSIVLALDPKGQPTWASLGAPRLGAAAAWVDGRGLVVAGGSATAPGVEVVGIGSAAGAALAYPPDDSAGTGGAMLDGQHVLLAGGMTAAGSDAGARVIDLACAMQCMPVTWTALPTPLGSSQVFASDATNALVVGNEAAGTTHVYRVTMTSAAELPTKVPHTNARALVSPLGSVVLLGGRGEIESFVP